MVEKIDLTKSRLYILGKVVNIRILHRIVGVRESILYRKLFQFGQGNEIFRCQSILVYRFRVTAIIYIYIYIYIYCITLSNVIPFNIFKINAIFDKSTVRLHYLRIFFMLAKF